MTGEENHLQSSEKNLDESDNELMSNNSEGDLNGNVKKSGQKDDEDIESGGEDNIVDGDEAVRNELSEDLNMSSPM